MIKILGSLGLPGKDGGKEEAGNLSTKYFVLPNNFAQVNNKCYLYNYKILTEKHQENGCENRCIETKFPLVNTVLRCLYEESINQFS